MKPNLIVDGSSGDYQLERDMAAQYLEIWERFQSDEFERDFRRLLEEKFTLFKKKQASYGPNNIAALGMRGIFVRIWDKVQRLRNLVWENKTNTIEDESIEDTFGDLAVYSMMAVVLMQGKWPKYVDSPLTENDALKEMLRKAKEVLKEVLEEEREVYDKDRPFYTNTGLKKLRVKMENGDKQ